MISIPIYMLGTVGVSNDKDPLMSPCVNCLVVNPATGVKHLTYALLDSGAHPNAISGPLAVELGLPIVGEDTLHAALSVEETDIHAGQIVVEGLLGSFDVTFQATRHHLNGHPYEVILGRKFLTAFSFGFDHPRREWYLTYPDENDDPSARCP